LYFHRARFMMVWVLCTTMVINGVELKNNIKKYWWDSMVLLNENVVGLDAAIFMHPTTWKASGHVDAFNDPLIDNKDSKKRYRADVLIETYWRNTMIKLTRKWRKLPSVLVKASMPVCSARPMNVYWNTRRNAIEIT